MRQFEGSIGPDLREQIIALAQAIFDAAEPKKAVRAEEFAIEENPEQVVVHQVDLRDGEDRLRIAITEASARPPFEWLIEITDDIGEADYFKHYLIRDDDIVLAQRKVLTPIDPTEAETILADLKLAQNWI